MAHSPPLKPLHSSETLNNAKLTELGRLGTDVLTKTLVPGQAHSLKARPDGTMLVGHHRIAILRARGVDVDSLPRDIIPAQAEENPRSPEEPK
jgi:hypothetical protein